MYRGTSSSAQHHQNSTSGSLTGRRLDGSSARPSTSSSSSSTTNNNNHAHLSIHHRMQQQHQHHNHKSSSTPSSTAAAINNARASAAAAASTNAAMMRGGQDKFERFENWLRENGAKFDMLELREYECTTNSKNDEEKKEPMTEDDYGGYSTLSDGLTGGGGSSSSNCMMKTSSMTGGGDEECEMRGVHARTHIPPNTVCMSIPRRCLITVEMGQATPIGQAILHSDLDLDAPKHIFLMIYILWDRKVNGSNSFFSPYYDILPPTLSNMPIFWDHDELQELEGSYLLQQIQDRNQAITEDYYSICQICPMLRQIATLDEFKWARMCVCSRNFGLQMDGHRTSALVPHADMLNHYRPRETKWTFDEERQAFTITSLQHIPLGAQVYDSYGQKCNHRFLLNYGFAVEDNRELDGFCPNEVPIELYVDPNDPLFVEKLEYWTRGEGGSGGSGSCSPTSSGNSSSVAATVSSILNSTGVLPGGRDNNRGGSSGGSDGQDGKASGGGQAQEQYIQPATPVVKRVRVCVSNNENTRLLFSLLRALACNREELIAIGGMPPSRYNHNNNNNHQQSNIPHSNHSHHYSHNTRNGTASSSTGSSGGSFMTMGSRSGPYDGNSTNNGGTSSDASAMARGLLGFPSLTNSMMVQHRQPQQQQHPSLNIPNGMPSFSIRGASSNSNGGSSGVFAFPGSNVNIASSASCSSANAYHRSCRDIRHPISLRNERAALHLLLDVCQRHLQQYPATLAQDVTDLLDENAFPRFSNRRHAKIQVRGEKEVLHHFAQWARTGLEVLDIIEEELNEERGSVEVQLNSMAMSPGGSSNSGIGRQSTVVTTVEERPGFEYVIRRMEEDVDNGIHHTVLRYCADVLGSLRREEFKNLRRHHQQHYQSSPPHGSYCPQQPRPSSNMQSSQTSHHEGGKMGNSGHGSNASGGRSGSNTFGRGTGYL